MNKMIHSTSQELEKGTKCSCKNSFIMEQRSVIRQQSLKRSFEKPSKNLKINGSKLL